jgi:predicted lipoprotein with Yx(FWY)xxD motif
MRTLAMLLIAGLLGLPACGGAGENGGAGTQPSSDPTEERDAGAGVAEDDERAAGAEDTDEARERDGTAVRAAKSEFGRMLFDSNGQAVYVYEKDQQGRSVCYGDCAEAWPPVFTDGEPVAGEGVKAALLGTVKRRGGTLQVSYAGKPLYYYAHEAPGEVRCHNVNLNGGFWWVVGPDGERRP